MFARFRDENAITSSGRELSTGMWVADRVEYLTLADGRRLAWSEYGHRHGYPLLYLHREAGSRLEAKLLHESASAAGFRLIAVDRPGIGDSGFKALSDIKELVGDYQQLLNHLNLEHVGLISWGAGSLLAVDIARTLSQRVSLVNMVSPWRSQAAVPPLPMLRSIATALMRLILITRARRIKKDQERYFSRWREQLCHADRMQIDNPKIGTLLREVASQSVRQGSAGAAQDLILSYFNGTTTLDGIDIPVHEWSSDARGTLELLTPDTGRVLTRHIVRRQGQLFINHTAAEIFAVARQSLSISPVVCDPKRR